MTKLILTMTAGAAVLLVSCEPISIYPPNDQRRGSGNYQQQRNQYDRDDGGYSGNNDRPPAPEPPTRDQYPTAGPTNNSNQVISPYSPYNVIDVEGFRSGQLAKDPSNGKIFRIP